MDEKVRQAIRLIQAGLRDEGKKLLQEALQSNPYDELAWMWLVEALDTAEARRRALEACLHYLPYCEAALRGLENLQHVGPPPAPRHPHPRAISSRPVIPLSAYPGLPLQPTPMPPHRFPMSAFAVVMLSIFLTVVIVGGAYFLIPRHAQGASSVQTLDPSGQPIQYQLTNPRAFTIADNGFKWTVTPKAGYQVTARLLGKYNYSYDPLDLRARLSPYDLALGWGVMGDPKVDQWITWMQRDRWYFADRVSSSPYKELDIGLNSANTHIIPATPNITSAIDRMQINDIIYLEGYLVNVIAKIDGTTWYVDTSLTRDDVGDGGCEQLYLERIIWNGQEYR